jgi:hypothetical protein
MAHASSATIPRLHRQLRNRTRLGHRLSGGLAWQGRRKVDARRAQPQAVGDVRKEQLRLPLRDAARRTSTCATGTRRYMDWAQGAGLRRDRDPIVIHIYSEFLQRLPAGGAGQAPGQTAARITAQTGADLLRPAAVLLRAAGDAGHRHGQLPAQRGDAAPHGDVPLVGLAERLAAPDPHPQLPVRQPKTARAGRGHRRRRLDVGRIPWGKVRCMCRHSEAVEPGTVWTWNAIGKAAGAWNLAARRQRIATRLPAQPPDPRGTAAGQRRHHLQQRPHHRPGRLVRRAGAHLPGRRRRARHQTWPQFAGHAKPVPGMARPRSGGPGWQVWAAGRQP